MDSILFDKQHGHVLKKFNFDLLTQMGRGGVGRQVEGSAGKIFKPCCCI